MSQKLSYGVEIRMPIFRILVLIDLVIMVQSLFQEPIEPMVKVNTDSFLLLGLVSLVLLGCYFFSILGLLMTKNWGSQLYLIVNVVGIIINYDLYGAYAVPFMSSNTIINVSGALTLAILYISQISHRKRFV